MPALTARTSLTQKTPQWLRIIVLAIGMTTFLAARTPAADVTSTWLGGTGNWNVNGNWSNVPAAGGYPHNGNAGIGTYAAIVNSGKVTLSSNVTLAELTFSDGQIASNVLIQPGTMTWSGGLLSGFGSLMPTKLSVTGGAQLSSSQVATNGNGANATTWSGSSNIATGNGAIWTNTGEFTAQNDQSYNNSLGGSSTFNNIGTFLKQVTSGVTSFDGVAFNNFGQVIIQSGTLRLAGGGNAQQNASFSGVGGTALEFSSGTFTVNSSEFVSGSFAGTTRINGGTVIVNSPFINPSPASLGANVEFSSGQLVANRSLQTNNMLWSGGTFSGGGGLTTNTLSITGEVELDNSSLSAFGGSPTIFATGRLTGSGSLTGDFVNQGTIAPGDDIGQFFFKQNLNSYGTIELDIASLTQFDTLTVANSLALNGPLKVGLLTPFLPQVGDSFKLFDFGNLALGGGFMFDFDGPVGVTWDTSLFASTGTITVNGSLLPGDLNSDGFVGQDDLNAILSHWGQSVQAGNRPLGDPSGDGFVGQDDLNAVLSSWGQVSPPVTPVPEPATICLLALGLVGAIAVKVRQSGR
ncbi:MAG: PEP-CTERM sorting domain-containing protein [Planctomycetota bacterium]|nr:PEP-CTERM sorting domain-containing protein [Planctomycetota bacterium]